MTPRDPLVSREELQATLEARRELGPEREPDVLDSFLDRLDRRLDQRIAAQAPARRERGDEQRRFVLALVSVLAGIPLTAIALDVSGLVALLIVWVGVVLVNVAFARRS